MRSILTVMAIEAIAPQVRTVVEVNNPQHVEHFRRANADEIMVTSRIASRLLARSSLYPGLAEIVTDIVSGGEGSELYRVELPAEFIGLSVDELSARLRSDHSADPAGHRPRRAHATSTRRPTSGSSPATTPWWWPSHWARWHPSRSPPRSSSSGSLGRAVRVLLGLGAADASASPSGLPALAELSTRRNTRHDDGDREHQRHRDTQRADRARRTLSTIDPAPPR